jgi:hypothetical protein
VDEFDPDGQKYPAVQFPEQAAEPRPVVAPKVPPGHKVGELLPTGQKLPAGQIVAVELIEPATQKYPALQLPEQTELPRPVMLPNLPGGHKVVTPPDARKLPRATGMASTLNCTPENTTLLSV